jgi:mono/diheme cytochrome c family protein
VSCASCHAGFNPLNPPKDVSEPSWDNIHPTIGNQHLKSGKILAANLPANDPRRLMLEAWPDGTVDTTALFSDHIMNPGMITPIWELRHRPTFNVGLDEPKLRMGQGGEDDLGGQRAALRVYTNIGVCFSECVAPRLADGRPIDLEQCRRDCTDLPPEQDLDDLNKFLHSIKAPKFPKSINVESSKRHLFVEGRKVFENNCASCHTLKNEAGRVLSNDKVNSLVEDPRNATNACRALTSQWEADHLWATFSSQVYKDRAAAGLKGYRTLPLVGVWATAPFLHNNSVGPYPPANASPQERAAAYEAAMRELLSLHRLPKINTLPIPVGPFPAGTPLTMVFSRDPATGVLLCDDVVENKGHYYGAELPDEDKEALIFWLKRQ